MRYINDITVIQAVLHVLDVQGDEPILSKSLVELDDLTLEFIGKHIIKSLNETEGKYAEYDSSKVIDILKNETSDFHTKSVGVANHFFDTLKRNQFCVSGDMLFVQFRAGSIHGYAILKLDYQDAMIHEINYDEGSFNVHLSSTRTGLPKGGQKLFKCAFYDLSSDQVFVINKKNRGEEPINPEYFVEEFMKCYPVDDDTTRTIMIKSVVEAWARNHLKDDIEAALEIREVMNNMYQEAEELIPNEIIETLNDLEKREDLINRLKSKGIDPDPVKIDKLWVEKSLKAKRVKTDTGFTVRADYSEYKDDKKFEIIRNGDGTINFIIKSIRNLYEA